ncbi:17929_t:CDS:2 [Entrophospora sp. SA101]|nr:17929_t:CDS:2 [Entrophospora sp. SA101]
MTTKNLGPCNVLNCEAKDVKFRRFTKDGLKNAKNHGTYEDYNYLEINDQLCPKHYLSIVQSKDVDTNNTEFKLSELLGNLINDNQINLDNWSNIDVDVQDDAVEEDITEEQIIALDFKNAFDLIKDW